jgi:2'-5' RNA ligase
MSLSCFVVLVPESEDLVGAIRSRFDDSARRGLGAHITVLYPFMAPERLDASILEQAAASIAAHESFAFQLQSIGRFPQVAYLKPEPAEPFIALSLSLARAFPQFPAYGGKFGEIVPHLTIAKGGVAAAAESVTQIMTRLATEGPVASTCAAVTLIENSTGRWQSLRQFALRSKPGDGIGECSLRRPP